MAGSLVKNDDDKTETIRLWQEVRSFLDREFPEAVLVSEWGRPEVSLKAGFHMDFFLHFGDTGYMDLFRTEHPFFNEEGKGDISVFVKHYQENEKAAGGKGMMCMPSGNHDMIRISKQLDTRQMKLAYAFIYALPGAPFLYYGVKSACVMWRIWFLWRAAMREPGAEARCSGINPPTQDFPARLLRRFISLWIREMTGPMWLPDGGNGFFVQYGKKTYFCATGPQRPAGRRKN